MADPRHPIRDNSRALGLVSDRSGQNSGQSQQSDGESGDDFARALDAALDAIRTAIDEDEPEAAPQPAQPQSEQQPGWTMPQPASPQHHNSHTREQRAFREISSDIAARHPELRSRMESAQDEDRKPPMPNAATLASRNLQPRQREPQRESQREPLSYEPYAPQQGSGRRAAPTPVVPANDEPDLAPMPYRVSSDGPGASGRDDHWSRFASDIDNELASVAGQARSRPAPQGQSKAPAQSAPHAAPLARAMQPQDLPAFGKNHDRDDAPQGRSGKGRVLAVSAIALSAALGFGAVAVWLGNELSGPPSQGDINIATSNGTVSTETVAALPPSSADSPARLEVTPVDGKAGETVALDVSLTAAPGERTAVLISGLPNEAKLSSGVDTGKGVWIVKPGDLDGLEMTTPSSASGDGEIKYELVASNGLTLDVQTAKLTLEGDKQIEIPSEPVTAGLTPKPVKTATVTLGAPQSGSLTVTQASKPEQDVAAPPIAPRAEPPASSLSGGGGGSADAAPDTSVQVADKPAQSSEPGQDLLKSSEATQPAANPVRLAAISPVQQPAAEPARVATPQPLSPEMQELVQRGNALMEIGDLASARLFFERAAEAGSADAALAMAKSYDPIYFEEQDVHGLPANPERAVQWYEKAAGLGSSEATTRLSALKARL